MEISFDSELTASCTTCTDADYTSFAKSFDLHTVSQTVYDATSDSLDAYSLGSTCLPIFHDASGELFQHSHHSLSERGAKMHLSYLERIPPAPDPYPWSHTSSILIPGSWHGGSFILLAFLFDGDCDDDLGGLDPVLSLIHI